MDEELVAALRDIAHELAKIHEELTLQRIALANMAENGVSIFGQ